MPKKRTRKKIQKNPKPNKVRPPVMGGQKESPAADGHRRKCRRETKKDRNEPGASVVHCSVSDVKQVRVLDFQGLRASVCLRASFCNMCAAARYR